jgi:hypothetical protein
MSIAAPAYGDFNATLRWGVPTEEVNAGVKAVEMLVQRRIWRIF